MRPNWDEYFLGFLPAISARSTCDRGRLGCVLVDKSRQIISTGYCGSINGQPHCDEEGHEFDQSGKHCIRTVHGEVNAIAQAAKRGVSTEDAILYVEMEPCENCAKLIIQCGIKSVICNYKYHAAARSRKLFRQADVELIVVNDEVKQYEK